jgi:hypothetical protein
MIMVDICSELDPYGYASDTILTLHINLHVHLHIHLLIKHAWSKCFTQGSVVQKDEHG